MGKSKGVSDSVVPVGLSLQQVLGDDPVDPNAPIAPISEPDATLLDVAEAAETACVEYVVPPWGEFRKFVMDHGNKYVRASYPNAPADLIETIWCGIPVLEHERARVMTPKGEWVVV